MSAVTDFLTQPGFGWGSLAGALVASMVTPFITARSVRASDKRKAEQEQVMDALKAEREDLRSNRQILRESANEFSAVCSGVMEKALDTRGVFNSVMDFVQKTNDMPDKRAMQKLEFAVDLMDEAKRITTAFNHLRVVAPQPVLDAAIKLNVAVLALTQTTTVPLAKPPVIIEAAKAMEGFTNAVRAELGLEPYTTQDADSARKSCMETLTKQMQDYIKETQDEARRFGFLEPGSVPITAVKAGDLTEEHVGKFVGCHDSTSGFNYGARILKIVRIEEVDRPGVLLRINHPPIPGVSTEFRQERIRLSSDHEVQLVELPDQT